LIGLPVAVDAHALADVPAMPTTTPIEAAIRANALLRMLMSSLPS
jgi:hypothetical protein